MKKNILLLICLGTVLFSCGKGSKSTANGLDVKTLDSRNILTNQKLLSKSNEKFIDTKFEYTESNGARIIIQNSFPKSGLNYTDPEGKKYVYAVFWSRVINETDNSLVLTIDVPLDSFEIPTSSGNYINLLFPADSMTIDKEPLYDYGLKVKYFLDKNRHKSASLKRTINAKGSSVFYIVTLSSAAVNGTMRTGFSLKEKNLFYRINNKEIHCGKIELKETMLNK